MIAQRHLVVIKHQRGLTLIELMVAALLAIFLVGGLSGIAFQLVCPDGGTVCSCDIDTDLANACIGVRVAMQFEGMRSLDTSGDFDDRSIELTAAFRNVILDRVNAQAFSE